jgi:insertion element IS1 protein InsB
VDEMCTYIKHKRNFIWLVYALEKDSKSVVSFNVGKRTNKTLSRVLDTLKLSDAKKIFIDGLKNYHYLLDAELHSVKRFGTNNIESKELDFENAFEKVEQKNNLFLKKLCYFECCLEDLFLELNGNLLHLSI